MSEEERLARKSFMEVSAKTDLFLAMLNTHQPHVAAFCLYGTDKLAHRFWHYMEPEKFDGVDEDAVRKYTSVLPDYYKAADAAFDRILSTLPEDTYVILVSDHGMKADEAIPRQFFLDIPAFLDRLAVADDVHYQKVMRHVLLEPIHAPIGFTRRLMEQIEQIHFEGDEDALFSVEEDEKGRISIRTNFSLTWNEDSPLLTNERILIGGQRVPVDELFFVRTFSGAHDVNGIFCLSGPGVKRAVDIQGASLLDIAPTMLYMLGIPVWRGMDGQVLTEAFDEQYIERYPIDFIEDVEPLERQSGEKAEDNRALMERLRSLGYIR
jgi:arylsulfatase A-like enzyme